MTAHKGMLQKIAEIFQEDVKLPVRVRYLTLEDRDTFYKGLAAIVKRETEKMQRKGEAAYYGDKKPQPGKRTELKVG